MGSTGLSEIDLHWPSAVLGMGPSPTPQKKTNILSKLRLLCFEHFERYSGHATLRRHSSLNEMSPSHVKIAVICLCGLLEPTVVTEKQYVWQWRILRYVRYDLGTTSRVHNQAMESKNLRVRFKSRTRPTGAVEYTHLSVFCDERHARPKGRQARSLSSPYRICDLNRKIEVGNGQHSSIVHYQRRDAVENGL